MGARVALTLVGARVALTLVGAWVALTLVGAWVALTLVGALESWTEPAGKLESTCKEQAPEGAGEELALGLGSKPSPHKPLTSPGVPGGARLARNWTEPVETKTGWAGPAAMKMSWAEPAETPAGLREPRTAGWASRGRRRRTPANGRPRSAAGGGGAPPSFLGPSICHGRVMGRTRETRGKVNKQSLMVQHRRHNYIDEMADKDSGETQGL